MRVWRVLGAIAMVALGAMMVRMGESDDSPGLGGIGIFIALGGVWLLVRPLLRGR